MVHQTRGTTLPPIKTTVLSTTTLGNSKTLSFFSTTATSHKDFKQFKNEKKPRELHRFHNLMFDPHVYRGRCFKDFREKDKEDHSGVKIPPPTSSAVVNFSRFSNPMHQKPKERKKKKIIPPSKKFGGIVRPTIADLVLSKKDIGFGDINELAKFIAEQEEEIVYTNGECQTDETDIGAHWQSIRDSPNCKTKNGKDAQTQAYYAELVPYEQESEPIIKNMSSKIMEQSLIECMEEEEMQKIAKQGMRVESSIRAQVFEQIRYEQSMRKNELEMIKLKNEEVKDFLKAKETEHRIGSRHYSMAFFDNMRCAGTLPKVNTAVEHNFLPWLNESTRKEVVESSISKQIVDDILKTVSTERETGVPPTKERKRLSSLSKTISFRGSKEVYFKSPNLLETESFSELRPDYSTDSESVEDTDESEEDVDYVEEE